MSRSAQDWTVRDLRASAAELHATEAPVPFVRRVWVMHPEAPALVLGSTQRELQARLGSTADIEVVVRRSGGGAVLVTPAADLWVDVFVPRGDELWSDDLSSASRWLGEAWVRALGSCGLAGQCWEGTTWNDGLARRACFAGLAPGEVTVEGRKVVGISQRRTRHGARFQCVVPTGADRSQELVGVLGDDGLADRLGELAGSVPVEPAELREAFVASLP